MEKIYLGGYTPAPEDEFGLPRAPIAKTALGAEKNVPWEKVSSTPRLLRRLKAEGKKIYAVEQSKRSVVYNSLKLSAAEREKAVLVVGNEVRGLSFAILKLADKILEIPMFGKKESLNVSVAFGIVAYGLRLVNDKGRRK